MLSQLGERLDQWLGLGEKCSLLSAQIIKQQTHEECLFVQRVLLQSSYLLKR